MLPLVNKNFARELEQSETAALSSRLTAMAEQPGNPYGVVTQTFGGATAFVVTGMPGAYFNSVRGLGPGDVARLGEILRFYREHEVPCCIHLQPGATDANLLAALHNLGMYPYDVRTTLYGLAVADDALSGGNSAGSGSESSAFGNTVPKVTVRELGADEFPLFGDVYTRAFGMPSAFAAGVGENNRILHGRDGWRFYLASVDDEPAAVGTLFALGTYASLAAAAVVPDMRRRGCHAALLRRRIAKAAELGCEVVVGQASFGSQSQTSMERAGLRIGYTKGVWRARLDA